MELNEVLPSEEAARRVNEDVVMSEYDLTQVDEICDLKRRSMLDIGLAIGYRLKVDNPEVNLEQFADAFANADPKLYERFDHLLGEPTLNDVCYSHVQLADENVEYRTVAELLVAVAYPNVLHIGDVQFSNPHRPVTEQNQIRVHSHFKGLGLLPTLIDNCIEFAQEYGLDSICLTPAADDLVPVFESVGLSRDDNPLAEIMRQGGMPGPMSMRLR